MNGKFITFEGGEGAGKTSILNALATILESEGYEVMITREPGGVKIAEQIRSVILDNDNTEMDPRTEALLYAAARRQHLAQKVVPALNEGKIVLSDRFVDSSLAYQGFARGLGIDEVYSINQFAIGDTMPDATIYLDILPEIGLQRINQRNESLNRLDLENEKFHHLVYEGYQIIQERFKERIVTINANNEFDVVLNDVYQSIKNYL